MVSMTLLVVTINMFLTALCAYCLCVAITRNSPINDDQTRYLRTIQVWLKHFIRVGGFAFVAWLIFAAIAASQS